MFNFPHLFFTHLFFLKQLNNLYKFMLLGCRHEIEISQGKIEGHK